jgi:PiT family inorganic phosphate transporter
VVFGALIGASFWNILTWLKGIPSSSSHALVGGLVGAAVAAARSWDVVIWSKYEPGHWYPKGLLGKVVIPMFASPILGFILAFFVMGLLFAIFRNMTPRTVNTVFGRAQLASAMSMGFMHGTNDAQKTMGIIALALAAGEASGRLATLPSWLSFLHTPAPEPGQTLAIATWIKVMCALVMAAGTASGGWRIIKTLGHKMVRLQPVHGFAAEASSAAIIGVASHFGFPVSTTHTVSAAIMGVGAAKRLSALKWTIVERMIWAWVLTIPISATLAFLLMRLLQTIGYVK